jgi:lysophospholipase L1-like esterase
VQAIGPPPDCQYDTQYADAYPSITGAILGAIVDNFSIGGTQWDTMISDQVPQVPTNADVVIYEGGTNDLAMSHPGAGPEWHIDAVITAIRARAPRARIVLVGVRYYAGSSPTAVDDWDTHEQGTGLPFVDLRPMFPPGDPRWPDGTHPNPAANQILGKMVAQAIMAT